MKLLELRSEGLEVVELQVPPTLPRPESASPASRCPDGAKLVSVTRNGVAELADDRRSSGQATR